MRDLSLYLAGYKGRDVVECELREARKQVAALVTENRSRAALVETVADLVRTIRELQGEWARAILPSHHQVATDLVSESFVEKIHTACTFLRMAHSTLYEKERTRCRDEFKGLPARSVEQIANARFLMDQTTQSNAPIFSGVILELCKAVESAVNEVIVRRIARECSVPNLNRGGAVKAARLRSRYFTMGELVGFLTDPDPSVVNLLLREFPKDAPWLLTELPRMLSSIKDTYRNRCAHHQSADRNMANQLVTLFEKSQILQTLNEIAIRQRVDRSAHPDSRHG